MKRRHPLEGRTDGRGGGGLAYSVDPVHVGADPGEDGGLLVVVAAEAGAEADDAVDLPASVTVLAVQGAARVPLFNATNSLKTWNCRFQTRLARKRQCCLFRPEFGTSDFRLTLQPATTPSPPAQTILVVTCEPHQSYLEQVAWSTTGRRACCRISAMGPPAVSSRDGCQLMKEGTSQVLIL